jgi:NAD(P)H dehydrogenase (quinone)
VAIAITGASGQLGRRTAELLLEAPDRGEGVVLVTRRPDAIAGLAERGADVRRGDFDDPASLAAAFAGVRRLLLISGDDLERRLDQHRTAIGAARDAGVEHVAYTSVVNPEPPNPAAIAPSHLGTEAALRESGLGWTFLRNGLYAEYQVPEATEAVRSGTLLHNRGDGAVAYVSREDCAAAAAAAVSGTEGNAIHEVTGPAAFDAAALARLYAELGGRPVEAKAISDDELLGLMAGEDEHAMYAARLVVSIGRAAREGRFATVGDGVRALTGRDPRALRDVLSTHLPASAQS